MIGKHFTETSNKVELRINRVRINRARPVVHFTGQARLILSQSSARISFKISANMN